MLLAMLRFRSTLLATLLGIFGLGAWGCSDTSSTVLATDASEDATAGDAAQETQDAGDPNRSYYRLVIDTEFEEALTIERDLTDKLSSFAFGSTHIAPAVSLAISDDITYPATMNIIFNFGIVLGSQEYPVQCDEAGQYDFGGQPPEIDVTKGIRYVSSVPGSTGALTITSWTRTEGEVFSGTFSGRIRQLTDNVEKRYADVEGEFHFVLPAPAAGQPN